jgi:hypothetical protein
MLRRQTRVAQRDVVRHRLVITPRQRGRGPQPAGQVERLQNLHDLLAALHSLAFRLDTLIENSQPDSAAEHRQRHERHGDNSWPSVGRFHDRQRGDQLTVTGEDSVSADTHDRWAPNYRYIGPEIEGSRCVR